MGFTARKSFKLAPGVRMTVSPRGVSYSAGVKGARVTRQANGRVTRTLSVPGSGISHTKTLRPATSGGTRSSSGVVPSGPAPKKPVPGLFAPKWEKELHKVIVAKPDPAAIGRVGTAHPEA